jgi:hypothetical protein
VYKLRDIGVKFVPVSELTDTDDEVHDAAPKTVKLVPPPPFIVRLE